MIAKPLDTLTDLQVVHGGVGLRHILLEAICLFLIHRKHLPLIEMSVELFLTRCPAWHLTPFFFNRSKKRYAGWNLHSASSRFGKVSAYFRAIVLA